MLTVRLLSPPIPLGGLRLMLRRRLCGGLRVRRLLPLLSRSEVGLVLIRDTSGAEAEINDVLAAEWVARGGWVRASRVREQVKGEPSLGGVLDPAEELIEIPVVPPPEEDEEE